jgi:hypothetical protein
MEQFNIKYKRISNDIVKAVISLKDVPIENHVVPVIVLDISASMSGKKIRKCVDAIKNITDKIGNVHLLTYDDKCYYNGIINSNTTLTPRCSSNTSFYAAYKTIVKIVSVKTDVSQIIFMTDGEDNISYDTQRDRQWLKCQLKGKGCIIHTIGIESASHTQDMIDLSKCGSSEGTYGYFSANASDSHIIETDRLVEIIKSTKEVVFNGEKYFMGTTPIEIFFQNTDIECAVGDMLDEIDYLLYKTNELIKEGNRAKIEDIQIIRDDALKIFEKSGMQSRSTRKIIRERLSSVHKLINHFYEMINKRNFTHEKLALLNIAARDARSKRFTKPIVNRSEANLAIIEKEDKYVHTLIEEFKQLGIKDQPDDLMCMISHMNVSELLADGDCIGIGVNASVIEACIVDPTLLKINAISTSHFGCSSFLDAAEYAINVNGDNTNIISDSSRNQISGVLPLFLNPTHWKIAKLYLRRMAGHLCCKDPLLGTNNIIFYTYLIVYRFCKSQPGEFFSKTANLICETLVYIYQKNKSIIPTPDVFCESIEKRMPDVVPSIELLEEAYLALALKSDNLHFHRYIEEEKLRRKKLNFNIKDVCIVDNTKWIKPFVDAKTPRKNTQIYGDIIEIVGNEYPDALPLLFEKIGMTNISTNSVEANPDIIDPETYDPIINLPVCMNDDCVDLSPNRRALILLQTCKLSKMSDCVSNYCDLFSMSEEEISFLIKQQAVEYIKRTRLSELNAVYNRFNKSTTCEAFNSLSRGVPLLQRVTILNKYCYIGRNIKNFAYTVKSFEELKMLVQGFYDIAPLIGYNSPIKITTVNDISTYSAPNVAMYGIKYDNIWLPKLHDLKRLCRKYPKSQLMTIMPQVKYILDLYCTTA